MVTNLKTPLNELQPAELQALDAVARAVQSAMAMATAAGRVLFIREALKAVMAERGVTANKAQKKRMESILSKRIDDAAHDAVNQVCGPIKLKAKATDVESIRAEKVELLRHSGPMKKLGASGRTKQSSSKT
jgi:hypothetical protein